QAALQTPPDYSHEPTTVFLVTGANATALYHRTGCPWLRQGANRPLALDEAKKRYFQPHCQCISGRDSLPPCFDARPTASQSAATGTPQPEPSRATSLLAEAGPDPIQWTGSLC